MTTEDGSQIFVYESGQYGLPESGGLCGFDTGFWCTADLYFDFFEEIADLEFETFFFGGDDKILAQIFAGDVLLSEFDI